MVDWVGGGVGRWVEMIEGNSFKCHVNNVVYTEGKGGQE